MEFDINLFRGIYTVVLFATFIGLWIWAWSGKRKKEFDEAANIPFMEDQPLPPVKSNQPARSDQHE